MITTKTTGICDRCKVELTMKINKITISNVNIITNNPAYRNFQCYDGIAPMFQGLNSETDGSHLCDVCLKDFKSFMRNEKTSSSPNT